ncbi:hypothetical protein J4G43_026935 [Bradyrhizobium barranii subsp. barranii]|uniref:Uncharacterized protein n=1 Tax=Bradyrhizobium barranii subsp. barranii TaxID=2823807 RepID=A0A9X9XL85_9BRAD|nr:hypothetical protein [Bradyrhizobium barranii]UEM08429.1 hypothetical protein J4G43_026935 [Bradyrhizobium barranii subsp. barranii]
MTDDTALTRRRADNPHEETWHIYSSDVRIGAIGVRAGVPVHADPWAWSVGFYPGMEPGARRRGMAATFEAAREAFEAAWSELRLTIPDAAFAEWRQDRDWRAEPASVNRRAIQLRCSAGPKPRASAALAQSLLDHFQTFSESAI